MRERELNAARVLAAAVHDRAAGESGLRCRVALVNENRFETSVVRVEGVWLWFEEAGVRVAKPPFEGAVGILEDVVIRHDDM